MSGHRSWQDVKKAAGRKGARIIIDLADAPDADKKIAELMDWWNGPTRLGAAGHYITIQSASAGDDYAFTWRITGIEAGT